MVDITREMGVRHGEGFALCWVDFGHRYLDSYHRILLPACLRNVSFSVSLFAEDLGQMGNIKFFLYVTLCFC